MYLSRKAQEEESKESDEWLQYLNANINDLIISESFLDTARWYTDVPVTLKNKEDKAVTVIGNFVRIDNGEIEPMLFFGISNIRKVQGVSDPNKNQFRIKLHGKAYIIPTFSKAPVVKNLPKKD
ncbi:uncharacterized protein OCT59_018809 [Rhizophagus irregularis]|uniref:uncharacterized protein n=1 Tax=Rhizophagus irregularis TaxID=588596 RepID=UPI00331C27CB|nr:hypothetical protein OCT59_018809 [Rhizophagus irregularis]